MGGAAAVTVDLEPGGHATRRYRPTGRVGRPRRRGAGLLKNFVLLSDIIVIL
jgi:hypothetical protein